MVREAKKLEPGLKRELEQGTICVFIHPFCFSMVLEATLELILMEIGYMLR